MNNEKNKIIIVVVILLVLISGIYIVRSKNKSRAPSADEVNFDQESEQEETQKANNVMFIKSESADIKVGDTVPVAVYFKAPGKTIFGADAILLYDPEYLSTDASSITDSDFFETMPGKRVDRVNGIIRVSAIQGKGDALRDTDAKFFSVSFKALKKGQTDLAFTFEKGMTNATTLVEKETSLNILEQTEGIVFEIGE